MLQTLFGEFREKVTSSANKLFVMVVDEAHHAAVRRGAHDAFANDFRCQTATGEVKHGAWKTGYQDVPGEWDLYDNLVTILVSATTACVLTADSRVPRQYYVPHDLSVEQQGLAGTSILQRFSVIKADSTLPHGTMLDATTWLCGEHQVQAADLRALIKNTVRNYPMLMQDHESLDKSIHHPAKLLAATMLHSILSCGVAK